MSDVAVLKGCTVLGGSGFPFSAGDRISIVFDTGKVDCRSDAYLAQFSLLEVSDLSIAGPGAVTTGGGFMGGGFGVEGALSGMAIAGVLNMLTTSTAVHTLISLTTNFGELHLHYEHMDPGALRISLSGVFTRMRRHDQQWAQSRKDLLDASLQAGEITEDERDAMMARIDQRPEWICLTTAQQERQLAEERAARSGPQGTCPNCDKTISLHSETCRYCGAIFDDTSSWCVMPIT